MIKYELVNPSELADELTMIANTIRIKNNSDEPLKFPLGFINAINSIPTGGIIPSGTKEIDITQNGVITEDVTNYANVQISTEVADTSIYEIVGGTIQLENDTHTIPVEVPFEPTHAICYAETLDPDDWTDSWYIFSIYAPSLSLPKVFSIWARTVNNALQITPAMRDTNTQTYDSGIFNFYDSGYFFKAGKTYSWFCWREREG